MSFRSGFQDLDAQYNALFYNPAIGPKGQAEGYRNGPLTRHNDTSSYMFENGTRLDLNAFVTFPFDVDLPDSGTKILKRLLQPLPSLSSLSSSSKTNDTESFAMLNGSPFPTVQHSLGIVSGYFLNETGNSNAAVLKIASFETTTRKSVTEFQETVFKFLRKCQVAGKKKLIVDVRGNGGGKLLLGYDLFKQLFPQIVPYSGHRLRGSKAADILGRIASSGPGQRNSTNRLAVSFCNARVQFHLSNTSVFRSWEQLYPPLHKHNDLYSKIASWQSSNARFSERFGGVIVSGYANNSIIAPQVFASEHITLVRQP